MEIAAVHFSVEYIPERVQVQALYIFRTLFFHDPTRR